MDTQRNTTMTLDRETHDRLKLLADGQPVARFLRKLVENVSDVPTLSIRVENQLNELLMEKEENQKEIERVIKRLKEIKGVREQEMTRFDEAMIKEYEKEHPAGEAVCGFFRRGKDNVWRFDAKLRDEAERQLDDERDYIYAYYEGVKQRLCQPVERKARLRDADAWFGERDRIIEIGRKLLADGKVKKYERVSKKR